MNVWVEFVVWLVFIVWCVWAAAGMIGEDVEAADREALLDALWGIDYDEEADAVDFERLLGSGGAA